MSRSIWLKRTIEKVINSIAFIPAIVVVIFLLLSIGMIYLDYSELGKSVKASNEWIRIKDAETARSIVSVIAAGLISITVFSFSMVMIVLNQAASQLSNRVLDKVLGNRFHQFIIGFYIGDIIYALLLLTAIRDNESGIYVPALSTYLLIVLSVIALFLFVIFLHFITQITKYSTIIRRIYKETKALMEKTCYLQADPDVTAPIDGDTIRAGNAGIFERFDQKQLVRIASENDFVVSFRYPPGHFVLKDVPVADIRTRESSVSEDLKKKILSHLSLFEEPSVDSHFYSGFKQLSEIAIKALSPGINDPGTAAESLQALFALLSYRRTHFPDNNIKDDNGVLRIITKELTFDEIFERYILPVWDYGKNDRIIRNQMGDLITQLNNIGKSDATRKLLSEINGSE